MQQLVILAIVWGIFIIASKLLPPRNKPLLEKYNIVEIRNKYKKIEWFFNILILLLAVLLIFLFSKSFASLQLTLLKSQQGDSLYIIPVTIAAFVVPSIFLGIIVAGLIGDYILLLIKILIKADQNEWAVFLYDMNKRQAFGNEIDNNKLSNIVMIVLVPLSLIMIFLALNTYTIITDNYLIDNSYLSLSEKKYPYTEVSKILHTTKFKNKLSQAIEDTEPSYTVIMNNGYEWNTLNATIHNTQTEIEIINLISQKSGIQINEGVHNIDDL
jgi:hypothetical protein